MARHIKIVYQADETLAPVEVRSTMDGGKEHFHLQQGDHEVILSAFGLMELAETLSAHVDYIRGGVGAPGPGQMQFDLDRT